MVTTLSCHARRFESVTITLSEELAWVAPRVHGPYHTTTMPVPHYRIPLGTSLGRATRAWALPCYHNASITLSP